MLFDFRIRPPFKSFLTTGGMFGGHDGSHDPAYIDPYETGKDPIPSADKGDMDLFFQEMEANGIDKAGIIGATAGPTASSTTPTSASSSRKIRTAFSALRASIPMRPTPWMK